MKLAIAGKGGVGKTSICGTLARVLARDGYRVLAIDNDMNPNLSLTLGIPPEVMTQLPAFGHDVVQRSEKGGFELLMSVEEICEAYSLPGPEGISLLVAGQPKEANTGCFGPAHMAVRCVIEVAEDTSHDVLLLDTEASTEHLLVATAEHVDAMFVVVEPFFTSLETGRRTVMLARDLGLERVALIANKVRGQEEVEVVEEFGRENGIDVIGMIPFDDCFRDAERVPKAPLDFAPGAGAMTAISELAPRLISAPTAAEAVRAHPPAQ
jgi:CO dehydrogenase maturation factor